MISTPNIKINLGLNVLRKRPDGYHDLETLFVPCSDPHDTLEIIHGDDWSRTWVDLQNSVTKKAEFVTEPGKKANSSANMAEFVTELVQGITEDGKVMITIARKEGVDWDPLEDLTVKAYQLLAEDFKLPPVKIYLQKGAPVGAGLGGGSADAAFALRMISEIAELGLTDEQLAAYAARLGSDCAFFIYNRPMFGSGRGEVLEDFPLDLSGFRFEISVPEGIAVSTATAYRGIVPRIPEKPLREILLQDPATWKDELKNDFEETVFAAYPALALIKEQLYERGALYAAMSGSGSAFFSIFRQ